MSPFRCPHFRSVAGKESSELLTILIEVAGYTAVVANRLEIAAG